MNFIIFNQYFTFVGSVVALILAIIKIKEHYTKHQPKVRIEVVQPEFYVEADKEKITLDFGLEFINIGTVPVQLKKMAFKVLDKNKHIIENIVFEESVNYYLEPFKHKTFHFERHTINEKYYSKELLVEIEIISTTKTWKIREKFLCYEEIRKLFEQDKDKPRIRREFIGKIEDIKMKKLKEFFK